MRTSSLLKLQNTQEILHQLYNEKKIIFTVNPTKNIISPVNSLINISHKISTAKYEISLRNARTWALKEYLNNPEQWREKSSMFPNKTNQYTHYNKIAYLTSEITQELGIACFNGLTSIEYVLATQSDSIVDDWLIWSSWLKEYRETQNTFSTKLNIPFHRRHGEWIAALSYIYMSKSWTYKERCNEFLKEFQYVNGNKSTPKKCVLELCKFESSLLSKEARKCVKRLVE